MVDEYALLQELINPNGINAALDVFASEPLPVESPLWDIPNNRLLISSHNADLTDDYYLLGWKIFLENLECFVNNKVMSTPVNRDLGY